jgi:hypothetical protein
VWKTVWRLLKKLKKKKLPYDQAIPLLGIDQRESKGM